MTCYDVPTSASTLWPFGSTLGGDSVGVGRFFVALRRRGWCLSATVAASKKSHPKYTPGRVAEVLAEAHGMVSVAARRLGCNRSTVQRYAQRHESVREALADARELMTDTAELALYEAIQQREAWAVCFYLKTQGKERGYVERQEHTGANGDPMRFTFTFQRAGDADGG